MDVYCRKCGEPWENDTFHDVAEETGSTYTAVVRKFQGEGCSALGSKCNEPSTAVDPHYGLTRQDAAGAMYDLLGDDMDGAAAMLDDLGW